MNILSRHDAILRSIWLVWSKAVVSLGILAGQRLGSESWHRRVVVTMLSLGLAIGGWSAQAAPDGSLTDTNIQYFGRWDFSNPAQYAAYWGGGYLKVGFSGTTVKVKLGNASNFHFNLDGAGWTTWTNVGNGTVNLTPTPLAAGNHTVDLFFADRHQTESGITFDPRFAVTSTPEPASFTLVGTGLAGLFGVVRRKRLKV